MDKDLLLPTATLAAEWLRQYAAQGIAPSKDFIAATFVETYEAIRLATEQLAEQEAAKRRR